MSFLGWIGVTNAATSLSLGIFVLATSRKTRLNQIYFLTNLAVAIYSFGYAMWQFSSESAEAWFWFKVLFDGTILINLMYLFFAFALTEELQKFRSLLIGWVLLNALIIALHHTGLFYDRLEPRFNMGLWPVPKIGLTVFMVYWHIVCFGGCYYLWHKSKQSHIVNREQIQIVMLACGIGYLGGATNWFMWYSVPITPIPTITISLYVALIAYAIVRHRLMSFGLVLRWGLAYFALACSLVGAIGAVLALSETLSKRFLHIPPGLTSIVLVCSLVFASESALATAKSAIDRFVFRSPDFRGPLEEVERITAAASTPASLAQALSISLKTLWGARLAGIGVWDFHNSNYVFLPAPEFEGKPLTNLNREINRSDFLIRTLQSERRLFSQGIIQESEITRLGLRSSAGGRSTFWKIRRTMRWVGADLCAPLMHENDLIGFIILGSKMTSHPYNEEDRKFLAHVGTTVETKFHELVYGNR